MNSTQHYLSTVTLPTPIQQDTEKLGGQPTIGSKRVQVATLIDYLSDGLSLADFHRDFPSVTIEESQAVLAVIKKAVNAGLLTKIGISDEDIV